MLGLTSHNPDFVSWTSSVYLGNQGHCTCVHWASPPMDQSVEVFLGKGRQGASRNTWYLFPTPIPQAEPQLLLSLLGCPSLVLSPEQTSHSRLTFLPPGVRALYSSLPCHTPLGTLLPGGRELGQAGQQVGGSNRKSLPPAPKGHSSLLKKGTELKKGTGKTQVQWEGHCSKPIFTSGTRVMSLTP